MQRTGFGRKTKGRDVEGPKGWKGCAWYELCGVWEALAAWGELLEKKQSPRARLGRMGHQTARTDDAVTDSSHITAVRRMEAETGEAGGDHTQVSKEHSFIFCYQLADTCFTLSQLSSNFLYNASFAPSPLAEKNISCKIPHVAAWRVKGAEYWGSANVGNACGPPMSYLSADACTHS